MRILSLHFTLSLLHILSFVHLNAQPRENPAVAFEFRVIGWEGAPDHFYIATPTRYDRIEVKTKQFSSTYQYRGMPAVAIYTRPPNPGSETPAPELTVEVPRGERKLIFIVLPTGENSQGSFEIMTVTDSTTSAAEGTITCINVTPATLGLKFGESTTTVPPQRVSTVPLPKNKNAQAKRMAVPIEVYWNSPEGWDLLRKTSIFLPPNSKQFIFFHQPVWSSGINEYTKDPIQWTIIREN